MRELFRGKRADTGEWKYGGFTLDAAGNPRITEKDGDGLLFHHVSPSTVGQYSGLTDTKGVKIFHGDIVRDKFGNMEVVEYCPYYFDWRIFLFRRQSGPIKYRPQAVRLFEYRRDPLGIEVIGNIFDNPELLEGSWYRADRPAGSVESNTEPEEQEKEAQDGAH